jgi:hypothetical protein
VWVETGLAKVGAGWKVIGEGSSGRVEGSLGGSEDKVFSVSNVGELEEMGTLGDIRSGESGATIEWSLEAMGGSCNSTIGLRDGVGSGEQGDVVDSGDVAEIVRSKGKGMDTSPVEDSCEGRSATTWSLVGKEVWAKTVWRDKYTLLAIGSRHL